MPKYGRIPQATFDLFEKTVQDIKTHVLPALPSNADSGIRCYAMERLLEYVLRDWRNIKSASALSEDDLKDLASFVQMAAALAGSQINNQGRPIFEATLRTLLEDWSLYWNAEGRSGPPSTL